MPAQATSIEKRRINCILRIVGINPAHGAASNSVWLAEKKVDQIDAVRGEIKQTTAPSFTLPTPTPFRFAQNSGRIHGTMKMMNFAENVRRKQILDGDKHRVKPINVT